MLVSAPTDRVWSVVEGVSGWPSWNPLVEWTNGEALPDRQLFTMLSAATILHAEVRQLDPMRYLHIRCFIAGRPQPPAADFCVSLVPHGARATYVIAQFSLEPWFNERLRSAMRLNEYTPASLYLLALKRVTEPV
jgi:hypothetical protein